MGLRPSRPYAAQRTSNHRYRQQQRTSEFNVVSVIDTNVVWINIHNYKNEVTIGLHVTTTMKYSSSDRTPVTQSYEDRMPAHANVYSMHGQYLNNLKETHYKIKSTHNNK